MSLLAVALWVPNVLLGPISLGSFWFLGVTPDSAETPFAKPPFLGSWIFALKLRQFDFVAQRPIPRACASTLVPAWSSHTETLRFVNALRGVHYPRGFARQGGFQKGGFGRCSVFVDPKNWPQNWNEGTFAKTTLLENRPFVSDRIRSADCYPNTNTTTRNMCTSQRAKVGCTPKGSHETFYWGKIAGTNDSVLFFEDII